MRKSMAIIVEVFQLLLSQHRALFPGFCMLIFADTLFAAQDGYRYMHVTIDTPWAIFLFLLVIVLFPFVLMAILYWHFAFKAAKEKSAAATAAGSDPEGPTA